MLICFDGLSGSGKTTQLNNLKSYLTQQGKKVNEISLPTNSTYYGKILKLLYSDDKSFRKLCDDLPSLNQVLISHDLKESYYKGMKEGCDISLMTRGIVATHALYEKHYISKYGDDNNKYIKNDLDNFIIPNVIIYLDCNPKVVKDRITYRNREDVDREIDKLDNMIRLRERSLNLYKNKYTELNTIIIDANQSEQIVFKEVLAGLKDYI